MKSSVHQLVIGITTFTLAVMGCAFSKAEDSFRPTVGKFPPMNKSVAYRGELVFVDHVNRRGSIRLHVDGHFKEGRLHHFAMLPYGVIRYRGSPAELKDIPVGTVVYGRFFLPPDPKVSIVPNPRGNDVTQPQETHAIRLEDGISLFQRLGKSWRLDSLEKSGDSAVLTASVISGSDDAPDGLQGTHKLTIDGSTRVWRGKELLGMRDMVGEGKWPSNGKIELGDANVQLALAWHPRYLYQQFHISDIWLDEIACKVASERQAERHIRHIKTRWMPAWVDQVDYGQFGQAVVTATLFGGMDPSLYEDFQSGSGGKMASAESTLRTWWPDHDGMNGKIVEVKRTKKNVPIGSSGIQIRFDVPLVLEGFRPGRIVRVRPNAWPNVKPPFEERVRGIQDRWPSHEMFKN